MKNEKFFDMPAKLYEKQDKECNNIPHFQELNHDFNFYFWYDSKKKKVRFKNLWLGFKRRRTVKNFSLQKNYLQDNTFIDTNFL